MGMKLTTELLNGLSQYKLSEDEELEEVPDSNAPS
jgi:hypothetical protein